MRVWTMARVMLKRAPPGNARALLTMLALLAGCARAPPSAEPPAPGDRLEARVNGEPLWTSDVRREAWDLGLAAPGEALARADPRFGQALDERIDEVLLATEAVRRGLDRPPEVRRRLAAARERMVGDLLLTAVVSRAADPGRVAKLRRDLAAEAGAAPPSDPAIVRFLSYQAVKDLVLSLRHDARIENPPTNGVAPPRRGGGA